ncbi:MAG: amidohydrolase [Archaeoglobaceae archaeon]
MSIAQNAGSMYDLAILGGLCWVKGRFVECNVAVNGNRISYVGKEEVSADLKINASGCFVLPALFNAHTHAAMVLLRGVAEGLPLLEWLSVVQRIEGKMRGEDVYWGSLLACVEMARSGVAGFADMYIHMDAVAKAVGDAGLRAALGYGMADRGDAERALQELSEGLRFAKLWDGAFNGRIRATLAPHAPYTCSPEFLEEVKRHDYVKHIHVAETLWEVREIKRRYGKRPVELLESLGFLDSRTVLAHAVWLSDAEIELLAKRKVSVAHCPASNMKLGSGVARVAEMVEAGVNVCIGTDGAASNNTLSVAHEVRIAALLQLLRRKPIKASRLIEMATRNGYRAYGFEGGEIDARKLADIAIFPKKIQHFPSYDENSIVFAPGEVSTLIVDGEVVLEDGIMLSVDEEKVLRKCEKVAERLLTGF